MGVLGGPVRQIVAVPAAKVSSTRRQVELADPPVARYAVDSQRAGEPPAFPAEGGARYLQADRNMNLFRIRRLVKQLWRARRCASIPLAPHSPNR